MTIDSAAPADDPAGPSGDGGDAGGDTTFATFFAQVERRLTVALVARYGAEVGRECSADAWAWGWENWGRLRLMANPAGYLYRVGQTAARRRRRSPEPVGVVPDAPAADAGDDVGLDQALDALSPRQRQVTVLVHAYGFTHREVGQLLGIAPSSVQNHLERGLARLRHHLEVAP